MDGPSHLIYQSNEAESPSSALLFRPKRQENGRRGLFGLSFF